MGMFKRGYKAVREEKERQDREAEKREKALWRFYLKSDGEEATVRFLTEEPINFYEHSVKSYRNGKEFFNNIPCCGDGCELCEDGDNPSFKGAFLIIDRRPFERKDSNGKTRKVTTGQIRLYVAGTKILSQLDRLSSRYGLTDRDYTITRNGKGTSTSYLIDRSDEKTRVSKEEIKNLLPEKLRDMYDGSMESLYDIIESQLESEMNVDSSPKGRDEEDDDDDDYDPSSNLVGDDDEEEEEEKRPVKRSAPSVKKKPSLFSKRK